MKCSYFVNTVCFIYIYINFALLCSTLILFWASNPNVKAVTVNYVKLIDILENIKFFHIGFLIF